MRNGWLLLTDEVALRSRNTQKYYDSIPIDELHVSISKGNKKIGHVFNVSTLPIITCPNCNECKYLCYDIRDCLLYGDSDANATIKARAKNTIILLKDREKYFREIEETISSYNGKYKFFRWHVGGECKDSDYFARMNAIAKKHPEWVFWTYTKNYKAVNEYVAASGNTRENAISNNFSVMFSEWRGMAMINPYGFPEFRVVFKDEKKPAGYYCPGNCDICKSAGHGCIVGETTYCNEH